MPSFLEKDLMLGKMGEFSYIVVMIDIPLEDLKDQIGEFWRRSKWLLRVDSNLVAGN